jgi:hypothetical protein
MNLAQRSHRKPWAISLALVFVCALLWAQGLGLTHRVVHGPQLAGSPVVLQAGSVAGSEAGFLAQLFAGHQGADCSTLDQLSHADALADMQQQALPVLAPLPLLAVAIVLLITPQGLCLQARGPPLSL